VDVCLLHLLNHCASFLKKSCYTIVKEKSINKSESSISFEKNKNKTFAKAKVLILTPMKNRAWSIINRLVQLSTEVNLEDDVCWKNTFMKDFGSEPNQNVNEYQESYKTKTHSVFEGNTDDNFCLGLKLMKSKISLYSTVTDSDILISSPWAMTKIIDDPGDKRPRNYQMNFLSSFEIVVVDGADLMSMQNWNHLTNVLKAINRLPESQNLIDISQIHDWCLSNLAEVFRQIIVISSFPSAEIHGLFEKYSKNRNGKWRFKLKSKCLGMKPLFWELSSFEGFRSKNIISLAEDRYSYFVKNIWPQIMEKRQSGLLIFVKSFFDFTRLKCFLQGNSASFACISEYSTKPDAEHNRMLFIKRRKDIMLYSEKAYFYLNNNINGIKSLLFYSLPNHISIYEELVMQQKPISKSINFVQNISLFSRYDSLQLGQVVGYPVMKTMIRSLY
jgi:U3 small nucleolar RNA-associated protein 25